MRFDANLQRKRQELVESILKDIKWLGLTGLIIILIRCEAAVKLTKGKAMYVAYLKICEKYIN